MPLLKDDAIKNIIISALKHRVQLKQVRIYAFVIMPNHMHLIWYIHPEIERADFQRDLLKYISRQIILYLKANNREKELYLHAVNARDRVLQIWERNALSVDIYTLDVFNQKLNYIHHNPLQKKWRLASVPEDYKYSSADFYLRNIDGFGFLSNFMQYY